MQWNNTSIQVLINRSVIRGKDFFRQFTGTAIEFGTTGLSEIEFLKTAGAPVVGDTFLDAFGIRHKIRIVTQTDTTYVCFCTPTVKT